ncbi:MAG: type VI secretion system baseplate subunit TssG [Gammaproteobacteria bacterium]|nr:type VI secretion system baseplate subunit TssG [Gammaproteobacteria bacterium]
MERAPYRYSLFAALRLLEAGAAEQPRLGESRHPCEDSVRVSQRPSLRFAPADVVSYARGQPDRLVCESFGLFGPNGPLPLHLTEHADERARQHQDPTFAAFVNAFQHRLACLFYRAWANAQLCVQHDHPERDHFAVYIGALIGIGTPSQRERDSIGDCARLSRAGRFAPAAKSAEGLEDILLDYFAVPCRVEQFEPRWLDIPPDDRLVLGRRAGSGLGSSANLGRRSWQCQFSFRLDVGPLSRDDFDGFLPGGRGLQALTDLVRAYAGDELAWDASLLLRQAEVPALRLARGPRLGWSSWLGCVRADAPGPKIRSSPQARRQDSKVAKDHSIRARESAT